MKRKREEPWDGSVVCVNIPPGGDVKGAPSRPPTPDDMIRTVREPHHGRGHDVNPFDVVCMRMIASNASAIHDYLAADPEDAALADVAGGLARALWARVKALEAR